MYRICILSLLLFACKGNNTPENTPTEEPVTEQREQTDPHKLPRSKIAAKVSYTMVFSPPPMEKM